MHEDAFEDDLLDQLLSIHMRPPQQQLLNTAATPTTDSVWQQLQQQQQQSQPGYGAGAAAAAVEAAVAAINAMLSGTASTPRSPPPAVFSRQPLNNSAAGPQDVSSSPPPAGAGGHGQGSFPSFYRALMATGGVLRPPGGPPIPLNVDYATEIQPHLGRLLGRGGFGAVYIGTWRGQRVSGAQGLAPACVYQRVPSCCVVCGILCIVCSMPAVNDALRTAVSRQNWLVVGRSETDRPACCISTRVCASDSSSWLLRPAALFPLLHSRLL